MARITSSIGTTTRLSWLLVPTLLMGCSSSSPTSDTASDAGGFTSCTDPDGCTDPTSPGSGGDASTKPGQTTGKDGGPTTVTPTTGNDAGATPGTHLFGTHSATYATGTITPTGSRSDLDNTVTKYYDAWKANYVKQGCGGYYILTGGGTGTDVGDTVSEGHGYGMVVTAMMAGYDPDAQKTFDGMFTYYKKFQSVNTPGLMGWTQDVAGGCKVPSGGDDSATDGDLDIAFSLLLADKQWGSTGAINYLQEAKTTIAAVKKGDMNATNNLSMLGDWSEQSDYSTRPSDHMIDHFRAFGRATGDAFWTGTVDNTYTMTASLLAGASSKTGFMPDFVVDTDTTPQPAPANYNESDYDGAYYYNSCRNPWRIGTDFVITGDSRSRTLAQKVTAFIKGKTNGDPSKVVDGYQLDGTAFGNSAETAFIAPLGVAAMSDPGSQAWLDAVWKNVVGQGVQGYYGDSISMQCLLVMAGDWWAP